MTTLRTNFTFRIDTWTPNDESIIEYLAGLDDHAMAVAAYWAAVAAKPSEKITLRQRAPNAAGASRLVRVI